MKEELISFETAKLAKEKGFDIPCDARWWIEPCSEWKTSDMGAIPCNNSDGNSISRPTQSLLQKWLREVHNVYVDSYHDLTSDGKSVQYYTNWGFIQSKDINGKQNVNGSYDEYNDWKTYEESLEVGLQNALKLI